MNEYLAVSKEVWKHSGIGPFIQMKNKWGSIEDQDASNQPTEQMDTGQNITPLAEVIINKIYGDLTTVVQMKHDKSVLTLRDSTACEWRGERKNNLILFQFVNHSWICWLPSVCWTYLD